MRADAAGELPSPRPPRRGPRRSARLAVVLLVTGSVTAGAWRFWGGENFGAVEPGKVYRSRQPGSGFRRVIRECHLGSVLNLRGGSFVEPYYADEVATAREEGVDFYDFPLSATRRPTRRELLTLLDFFGRCRYPLLIHCKSGSDRTALASALYRMAVQGVGPDEALRSFSIGFGHVGLLGTERLHEPFEEYSAWLKRSGLVHTPERFRRWVECDYSSPDGPRPVRPLRPGPRPELAARGAARGGLPPSR